MNNQTLYPVAKLTPPLRRALLRVNPAYVTWSDEEKERYHVTLPATDRLRIEQQLLQDLFGIQVRDQAELDDALAEFDDAHYLQLNRTILRLTGIGQDSFYLNEYLAENVTILDFPTLYDYALDDYLFQEADLKGRNPAYDGKPFRGDLHFCWARLFIDNVFTYATLSSVASYLYGTLDTVGSAQIDQLFPHEYVPGDEHGKREENGFIWDMRVDAAGMEGHLDELQRRFQHYLAERHEMLLDQFDQAARCAVYLRDRTTPTEPQMDFIFSDKTALQAVRFKQFVNDCRQFAGDDQVLARVDEDERNALIAYLKREYAEIVANFDEKIIKLRKKRKITLSEKAAPDFF